MAEAARHPDEMKTPDELYRYLVDRVAGMESQNQELKEHIRQLESDKRYIETQKIRYEREVRN